MKNWAENVVWNPSETTYPSTEREIQEVVSQAINEGKKIRLIGSGHSFSPLCQTDQITMSLDKFQGLVSLDKEKVQATVKAGTKLKYLGELLHEEGMAMENLGDIDVQSIGGTISTSTHGTGKAFGTISTQVIGLRFINGKGEIVNCSNEENPELFKAAQVSLGVLGVITHITLQCLPSYKLKVEEKGEELTSVLSNLQERIDDNRNFEFFWLPYTHTVVTKTSNIVESKKVEKSNFFSFLYELLMVNYALDLICRYAQWFPSQTRKVSRFIAKLVSDNTKIHYSHKVYASLRLVKFREMEYNIPAERFGEVWPKVMQVLNDGNFHVHFPLEIRWVKADDIFMSPAYGRDSVYIACHVYRKKEYKPYFQALENIFRAHGGRPHWGKINTLTPEDVSALYPKFPIFLKHRAEQDPHQTFMSPYLEKLLGVTRDSVVS